MLIAHALCCMTERSEICVDVFFFFFFLILWKGKEDINTNLLKQEVKTDQMRRRERREPISAIDV